ncbi:putative metallopeptidase [Pelagerythrobacter marinus]|uniref:putative metallopeptidase n=1 Tax=Pelagerythrobacter marinus TaxID=538382 RepID=UPI002AC8DC0D|nr:putative metallopeptidase [Pelagerythrobacter marinus]WPZ05646.1 putative metallopeptidase [Pelagerythrobacter marinus]
MLDRFEPAPDLRDWIAETFITGDGPLVNEEHAHLAEAHLGILWTNCDNTRNMRQVLGQTELMPPMAMGKWQRARAIQQIEEWFGAMPDFLITFSAPACDGMNDATFCALVEHELYHAAQKLDQYGMPAFHRETGKPIFAIRGHDVEEFTGVVRRYGADAAGVRTLVDAANAKPLIDGADLDGVCGTCLRAAA